MIAMRIEFYRSPILRNVLTAFAMQRSAEVKIKFRWCVLIVCMVPMGTGCRTILPDDQPSRLWEVYHQQKNCEPVTIHRPTRMVCP